MLMSRENRLLAYKESLRSAWGFNDYNDWPIKFNSIMHLFLEEFTNEFLSDLETIQNKKIPLYEISDAFGNPARIYRLINAVIFGMKRKFINLERQREIVLFLLDLVKCLKYGSEFNEDGTNIIFNQDNLTSVYKRIRLKQADQKSSTILQRFCGIMWAYTEAIFFRAHDVTKEIHGAYKMQGFLNNFLIREYLNLNPKDIWNNVPLLPCNTIKIYTEYSENLKISIDSYNHLFHHGGNYVQNLIAFGIECDGNEIELEELSDMIPIMQKTIESIHSWVNDVEWQSKAKRYADIYWYRKRPLRDVLGIDWKVPVAVYEKIDHGNVDSRRISNLSKEQIEKLINIII